MANNIAVYEKAIDTTMATLENILAATPGLPARSFKAAILSQLVNSKAANKLMECTLPSFLNCAATFAGLGLMPDGVTGQAYILPFAGTATPVIGYKGYNTLGERAGRTIDGNVVRDGEIFDFGEGTNPFVDHRRVDKATGQPLAVPGARILWAWASATSPNRTPLVSALPIADLEAVRNKSPAGNKSDSPWMDLVIGRPAMYGKTAKRRLARGMPLLHGAAGNYLVADALEGQFEATGRPHYLLPGGDGRMHITDGMTGERVEVKPPPAPDSADPTARFVFRAQINAGEPPTEFDSVAQWKASLFKLIALFNKRPSALENIRKANAAYLAEASAAGFSEAALEVSAAIDKAAK